MEQRLVGPSLGLDSIRKGSDGMRDRWRHHRDLLMLVYYKLSGVNAVIVALDVEHSVFDGFNELL